MTRIVPDKVGSSDCSGVGLDEALEERLLERMRIEVQNIIRDVEGEIEEHSLQLVEVWNHVIQESNFKVQIADLKREVTYLQVAVARMVQQKQQQSGCSDNCEAVEPDADAKLQQSLQGSQAEQLVQQAAFGNLGNHTRNDQSKNNESSLHMTESKQNSQSSFDEVQVRQQADFTVMTCIMDQTITQMASAEAAILKLQQDVSIQQEQQEVRHQVSKKMIADVWWEINKIQLERMNEHTGGSSRQTGERFDDPNLGPDAGDHPRPPSRASTPLRLLNDCSKPVGESRSVPSVGVSCPSTLTIPSVASASGLGGGLNLMSRMSRPPPVAVGGWTGQAWNQGCGLVPATPGGSTPKTQKTSRDVSPIDHSSRGVTPTRCGFLHNVALGLPQNPLRGGSSTISTGRSTGRSMTHSGLAAPSRRENSASRISPTPLQTSSIHPGPVVPQQVRSLSRLDGCGPNSVTPCRESSASRNSFTPIKALQGQLSTPLLSQLMAFTNPEPPNQSSVVIQAALNPNAEVQRNFGEAPMGSGASSTTGMPVQRSVPSAW